MGVYLESEERESHLDGSVEEVGGRYRIDG